MDKLHEKYEKLKEILRDCGSVAVAFSAGVDSTFLLKVAHDVLGDGACAVTSDSYLFPKREGGAAAAFCKAEGIRHYVFQSDPLSEVDGFRDNPKDRCYICKKSIFTDIVNTARQYGFDYVAEGSNIDDLSDFRPGMRAVRELGVLSPLEDAGLTKADIRALSKELGLPTWDKPSFACLATRFVHGETITRERIDMVDRAEQKLLDLGFTQVRVRVHGTLARIETNQSEIPRIMARSDEISGYFKSLGFTHVSVDIDGYRTGSMNI